MPPITQSATPSWQSTIVLTGPTAVGKSALALALAEAIDAEIVSADSRQVYHYLDIGTAKPSLAERAVVPHHLIDVVYPNEPYSIAAYQEAGTRVLGDIARRGRAALIVGGSPHYIQALMDRLQPAPRFPALRAWLEQADTTPGLLDAWLRRLDPAAARTIEPRNRRRILRALEVALGTGRPFSEVGRRHADPRPGLWIGLRLDRTELHARVARRLDDMLAAGWLDEVRTLRAMGYAPTLPSMSATGYAELAGVLDGELTLAAATQRIRQATHAFIRRQETWLRAERRLHWIDVQSFRVALDQVRRLLVAP